MTPTILDEGGCVGHAQGDCKHETDLKFPHFSDAKLQKFDREVVSRKGTTVSSVADGKKDPPKGKTQTQGKTVPSMSSPSNSFAVLSGLLTDILNETVVHNGSVWTGGRPWIRDGLSHDDGGGEVGAGGSGGRTLAAGAPGIPGDLDAADGDLDVADGDLDVADGDLDTADGDLDAPDGDLDAADGTLGIARDLDAH